jgi:phosphatidate cytidylyltransferase
MSNLTVRLITAFLAMPFFVFLLWFSPYSRAFIPLCLMVVGAWEFGRMISKVYTSVPAKVTTYSLPLAVLFFAVAGSYEYIQGSLNPIIYSVLLAFMLLLNVVISFKYASIEELFPWLAAQSFGGLFLGYWFVKMFGLYSNADGFSATLPLLFVAMSMWVSDSGAYFSGRFLGKHKFAPLISPKKTWEGFFGGIVCTVIFAVIVGESWLQVEFPIAIVLGVIMSASGALGDLLMSTLKRWSGTKDSSQIFPGHGGMLDRFDSLYLAAPLAVLFLSFFNS